MNDHPEASKQKPTRPGAGPSISATDLPSEVSVESLGPYPPIHQGASLLIALRLAGRKVLLIGGGVVAASRVYFLLESGAHITIVAPLPLDPSIAHRMTDPSTSKQITHHDREWTGTSDPISDLIRAREYDLVLTAIDDNDRSREACDICRTARVTVNVADIPPQCDFYFGAQLRRGPLQILISTGGMGPRAGALIRDIITTALPDNIEDAIDGVGKLRADLRKRVPGVGGETGQKRMDWMKAVSDKWGLEKMDRFRDESLRTKMLDQGWDRGLILGPEDLEEIGQEGSTIKDAKSRLNKLGDIGMETWLAGMGGFISGAAIASVLAIYFTRGVAR